MCAGKPLLHLHGGGPTENRRGKGGIECAALYLTGAGGRMHRIAPAENAHEIEH